MKTNRPILWAIAAAFLAAGVAASGAAGDGLPVLGIDVGGAGVASQSGAIRYVTMPAGPNTIVARADTSTGSILASRLIRGRFTIPAVAYDGSASGLSADGRTLVLIQPRLGFPRAQTPLLVIETQQLRPRKLVRLHGDFSFDAISLRGRLLYLIQYTTPTDPNQYLVRAYDLDRDRLLPKPIRDPLERRTMGGRPLTRATSANGHWAYTLYDGAGKAPFVHALQLTTGKAHCIDLDILRGTDLSRLHLRLGQAGNTLILADDQIPAAIIDLQTFRASLPDAPSPPTGQSTTDSGAQFPWAWAGLAGAVAAVAIGAWLARRKQGKES